MVKKGWETATDGIERPVCSSGLYGQRRPVLKTSINYDHCVNDCDLYMRNLTYVYFQTKESYLNTSVSADSDQYDHVTGVDGKRTEFFIEMAFYKTKRIIKFMNNIPGMHNLSSNARIWLFKESLAGKPYHCLTVRGLVTTFN